MLCILCSMERNWDCFKHVQKKILSLIEPKGNHVQNYPSTTYSVIKKKKTNHFAEKWRIIIMIHWPQYRWNSGEKIGDDSLSGIIVWSLAIFWSWSKSSMIFPHYRWCSHSYPMKKSHYHRYTIEFPSISYVSSTDSLGNLEEIL